jgi:hypothetical protein
MRGAFRVVASVGAIGVVACTSLLGDFTATTSTGSSEPDAKAPEASSDAGDAGDAGGPTDAGKLDAATGMLSCTTWAWPQHLVIEDLEAAPSRTFSGKFAVFQADTNQVRIVASKTNAPAYSVYTVTKNPADAGVPAEVEQLDAPTNDAGGALPFVSVIRHAPAAIGGTTAIVVGQRASVAAGTTAYSVTTLSDLMPATGPLPPPFTLLSPVLSTQVVDDLAVLPFSASDIFEAVSIGTGNPSVYTLGVGRVSPTAPSSPETLATIATSPNEADFAALRLLHTNDNVYIYDINDVATPGCSGWAVPDTAMVTTAPAKQVIASGASVGVLGIAPNGSIPAADVFMLEQDFSGQFTSGYKYYVGTVDFTSLSSWNYMNLTKLDRPTSAFAAPVIGSSPAQNAAPWFDDNTMLLGSGLRNGVTDAAPGPGLNLLWVNSAGMIRADQVGADEILSDRANFVMASAVPAHISATSAAWDIIWVEAITNAAGMIHHVMRMDELLCQ